MDLLDENDLLTYCFTNTSSVFSIDRLIENFAVCEDKKTGEMINISVLLIPKKAKPGDILKLEKNRLMIDVSQTKKQQDKIKNLANSLFKKKPNSHQN